MAGAIWFIFFHKLGFSSLHVPQSLAPPNKIISLAKASSRKEKQAGLGLISAPLLIYNRDKPLFSLRPVLRSHFALASTMLDHEASSP